MQKVAQSGPQALLSIVVDFINATAIFISKADIDIMKFI